MHRHSSTISTIAICIALLVTLTAIVRADPPRYIDLSPPQSEPNPRVVNVPGAHISRMEVSEPAGVLLLGAGRAVEHRLATARLQDDGALVQEKRTLIDLPVPGPLRDYYVYIADMVAHPTQPIVYIWCDITRQGEASPEPPAELVHKHLDHLLVYEVASNGQMKLLQRLARGERYGFGRGRGEMGLDVARNRLFVPNSYGEGDDGERIPQAAYVTIEDNGRVVTHEDGTLELVGGVGQNVFEPERAWPFGYIPVRDRADRVIVATRGAPATWDLGGDWARFFLYDLPGASGYIKVGAHPELPVVYAISYHENEIFRVRHARGMMTMLPQRVNIDHGNMLTGPFVTADGKHVVVGDRGGNVLMLAIDDKGRFIGEITRMSLPGGFQPYMTMTYSAKYDRIYARTKEEIPTYGEDQTAQKKDGEQ